MLHPAHQTWMTIQTAVTSWFSILFAKLTTIIKIKIQTTLLPQDCNLRWGEWSRLAIQVWHLSLLGHTAQMPDASHVNKQILTACSSSSPRGKASPLENWRRPLGRSCGWRLPSRNWNRWTSPSMKQLTWLRIVHSGEWCLCLALGADNNMPEMNEWVKLAICK